MDAVGKAGVGKRVLDENGVWRKVTSLPAEVQKEIRANTRKADAERRTKAMANNVDAKGNTVDVEAINLRNENTELKSVVSKQGEAIDKLLARLDKVEETAAAPVVTDNIDSTVDEPVVAAPVVKKVTKKLSEKQRVIAKLEEAGIEFEPSETTKDLKAKLEAGSEF